ncbi:MAG TPA: DUF6803 family protein [Usitatibacter sp.]|jgi:hypothetical protein|nr:DUF6803 family protein [Usitatibacter sp.]
MSMTHYMQLLAANQPWNLIVFMAIPIVLAETLAISELYLLFTRRREGGVRAINRFAGLGAGLAFLAIIPYLTLTAVIPLTRGDEWRGWIDVVAVAAYLLAGLPLVWVGALELRMVMRERSTLEKLKAHAVAIALFLVLAHVAMVFGMLDPTLGGRAAAGMPLENMQGMRH